MILAVGLGCFGVGMFVGFCLRKRPVNHFPPGIPKEAVDNVINLVDERIIHANAVATFYVQGKKGSNYIASLRRISPFIGMMGIDLFTKKRD